MARRSVNEEQLQQAKQLAELEQQRLKDRATYRAWSPAQRKVYAEYLAGHQADTGQETWTPPLSPSSFATKQRLDAEQVSVFS